jgi:hypothetical protein
MGEKQQLFSPEFNGSVIVEARPERLTTDSGTILLREAMERLRLIPWLSNRLSDPRDQEEITHPLKELLRTNLLLLGQGWRDHDDADALRNDPAFRLAVSERRGTAPLLPPQKTNNGDEAQTPDGLASQPTLSRLTRALATDTNRDVLREALVTTAGRRIRAANHDHRVRHVTLDIDSLPVEVAGHQPGSAYNAHYHARIYHPLVATLGQHGDLVDLVLREGNAGSATGDLDFVLPLLERVEQAVGQVVAVRVDAAFPDEPFCAGLESRGTRYVAREKNNPVLDRMAEEYLVRPVGRPTAELRTWFYELHYQAESWKKPRRVVLVVQERSGELLLHHFWLITNYSETEMTGAALLELYRGRGTAEGHMGELMHVFDPALSSSPRAKSHYRGETPTKRTPAGDSFAINEVRLLLNALAYNVAHVVRTLLERATGRGWSLQAVRERVLRVAGRFVLHGRRASLVINSVAAQWWQAVWSKLTRLHLAES